MKKTRHEKKYKYKYKISNYLGYLPEILQNAVFKRVDFVFYHEIK